MPTIDRFGGIKINVYNGDHLPPHIHVVYNEHEALLVIKNGKVYAGSLPPKQMKLAQAWLELNNQWALTIFFELNPTLK